jgi:alpha-beta hydrolase superfamily lysophospholipase
MKKATYQLDPNQVEALDLLLAGSTVTEAAAALGVARETVSRWRNSDPAFMAAYNAALQSAYDATTARLLDARGKALERLAALVDSKDEATALKAAAALMRVDIERPKGNIDPADIAWWQNFGK